MRERTASPSVVRAWGLAHGWKLGDRGRVPAELWEEYADAMESRASVDLVGPLLDSLAPTTTLNYAVQADAAARIMSKLVADGSTFAWERSAYVVRDRDGVELFRSPLGGDCARWATERGVLLGARTSTYEEESA